MAEKRLDVTELDFDGIKENLKIFLRGQTEFTDYDFEGSGMNILLDTLAYNTHYLAFNANMAVNESFLDSAALRSSIVSHAKTLGYEPTSAKASTAIINVTLNNVSGTQATMPDKTSFSGSVDGTSYTFVTVGALTASKTGSNVTFNNVVVYEGTPISSRYVVTKSDIEQRFLVSDPSADTKTLTVSVQNSSSDSTTNVYTKGTDISQLTSSSKVYFLQEVEAGQFEVFFGDGVVSKALVDGNIVTLNYVVTNKSDANGVTGLTNTGAINGISDIVVTTVSSADGGGDRETLSSIKLHAPLDYASQGRCVTINDYKVYAKKFFPSAQTIQVFGGEDGSFDPSLGVISTPEYGRVFISIKSNTGNNLTVAQKDQLIKDLKNYNVASITPVIVDPDITYLILQVAFKFDSNVTIDTKETLISNVTTRLNSWDSTKLKDFNKPFRHSDLVGEVDNTSNAILSSSCNVTLSKNITPTIGSSTTYTIPFNNGLYHPHAGHNADQGGILASTGFYLTGDTTNEYFLDDDGNGKVRRYYFTGSQTAIRTYADINAGTINYSTGNVSITSLDISTISNVDDLSSTIIRITVLPDSKDIVPLRNQLLEIDWVNSTITGAVDTIAVADAGGASSYIPTSTSTSTKSY